ncbi:tRNA uridine-5-carboxymethylaminomethyl(34) synthesis GTPase MnmE [Thiorhodovibrio frisius]|uniref:tRNA modification GTPase MnmE n=1 Tax=Thiorhodovibrio frisius TaxID=631362 RepID=H8Z1G5_9GAMM|nr:tRNA uridine-5-carboxymethylaminomethyl(34) synthesis GTPase MnmE [Thiorhodovibrio frisius]EIC22514.1 tRNA modification GTPase TrmE [Thiorhodovibrio frisius]WPL24814.1 tRNA modification GTPase MnmE [Thiorhodovibrio frisius]
MHASEPDTIAAVATATGRGGIGVVRVSGARVESIAEALIGKTLPPRQAMLASFRDAGGETIDQGIAVFFRPPASYTGEAVLELQAHGAPVVLDLLLARVIELGARLARPGEFTERAFLNAKLDLTQAEAVADLIASTNQRQARLARQTLEGALGEQVAGLQSRLTRQRVLIEAELDFSDEDIDPSELHAVAGDKPATTAPAMVQGIEQLCQDIDQLLGLCHQGERIRDGLRVVIAGPPNAGKSSLLNQLVGRDTAIVTTTPGTTRDLIRSEVNLDGMPLHLVDTAGIRDSTDLVEQEGIRRAREQIASSDLVLWLYDAADGERPTSGDLQELAGSSPVTVVRNKIDLIGETPGCFALKGALAPSSELRICAKSGEGLDDLKTHLKECAGFQSGVEGAFLARRRHLVALQQTQGHLRQAQRSLASGQGSEILAEDLRQAQRTLGELTGEFSSEDLLGEIFSTFCIGK